MSQAPSAASPSPSNRRLSVAIVGGGMFFDDIIGQSFKDFMRGGIAPGL
ncbi:MAG: hypothetical protein NTW19_09935 [Planctomycetota bacterium]|nr:hypothetical protein [Planctomycetota bacterium]